MNKSLINKIPKHLPNILTISRLTVIPIFIFMVYYTSANYRIFFLILFIYASATDFLDGYLARQYSMSSNFGRIFDSIADKALILVVSVLLLIRDTENTYIMLIPTLIILLRELVISGIREGLATQNIKVYVSKLGRYKTATQMLALGFLILGSYENYFYITLTVIGLTLLYLAAIITLVSGLQYLKSSICKINA